MNNINEELKRIKLLSSYDTSLTLNENYKINLLSENDDITFILNEQPRSLFRTLLGDIKGISSQVKDFSLFKGDIAAAEKFLQDASAGRAGAKELGTFTKDVLKDGSRIKNSKPGLFQGASESYAKNLFSNNTDDIAKQFKNATDADKRSLLKNAGYPEASINSIIKDYNIIANSTKEVAKTTDVVRNINGRVANVKDLKGSSAEVKELIKDVPDASAAAKNVDQVAVDAGRAGLNQSIYYKIGKKIGFYVPAGFSKIKNLTSKMNFRKLVLYGLAGYGTYVALKELFGDDPNPSVLDPCVVNSNNVELLPTSTGDIMGYIKTTGNEEYDSKGGLKFYSNGRVFSGDLSKKGKYSCSTGGQLKLGESTKKKKLNEETVLGNIDINWDIPGGGGEKKKFTWTESPSCDDVSKGVSTIKKGMKGKCVAQIQTQLKTKGFDEVGNPDEKFWNKTKSAVVRLQRNGGLNQTGVVDAGTYRYLFFDNASTPEIETLTSKKVTNLPNETPEPTLSIPKVDDGTTLPSGAIGPLNQPNYPN
jgi:hypothetical protein